MRFFFVVFFCFVFAFSNAFYALNGASVNIVDSLLYVFNVTLRKADTSIFNEEGFEVLLWMLFIVTSMFFTYIILNMTVAMVKTFLDQNSRIKTESAYQVMTHLTLDCFDMINIPSEERFLWKPDGSEDFVEDMSKYDDE